MKKCRAMRLASAMLVLTLLSTCMISGTFAKYVTSDTASDTARVAKWGVTVTASGSLFGEQYFHEPVAAGDPSITVQYVDYSTDDQNVVAPGTQNTTGMTFTIAGKPEVKARVSVVVKNADGSENVADDIFLAAKTGLPDMTTGNATDTFENANVYNPIKYTLTKNGIPVQTDVTLSELETALEYITDTYAPNTSINDVYKITWKWDFDNGGAGTYDKQDTLLGDLAAGTPLAPSTTLTEGTDYQLTTGLQIEIKVTQVD